MPIEMDNYLQYFADFLERFTTLNSASQINITHIGCTDGAELIFLCDRIKVNKRVLHGYEPNAYWHDKLPKGIILHTQAVGDLSTKTVDLKVVNHQSDGFKGCSSLLDRIDDWGTEIAQYTSNQEVEIVKGCDIYTPGILMIDAEGMTMNILQSFGDNLKQVQAIVMECEHAPIFQGGAHYQQCANYLESNGFELVFFHFQYKNQSNSAWVRKDLINMN